ncbi:MAG TPA: hypothetical protein VII78_08320 [Myxococcota bacterium]|jgi:hypothetical protein
MTHRPLRSILALALLCAPAFPSAAFAKDKLRQEVQLQNTGVAPAAEGSAELRLRKKNRMSFNVEAEDLAPANYDVLVAGVVRGVLDVRTLPDGRVEGEIEFDSKREPGHVLLDFDPRGQLVTVERAGTVYLQVVFPTATTGGSCTP